MFKLLYKTGKNEKKFSKLEWVEKSGKENDEISPFFQENLKNIFPELIFIFKENRKGTTRYKFSEGRELDGICGYPKGKFFIIFEYKSKKPREVIDQIFEYLEVFSYENNEDCRKLFSDLNKSLSGGKGILWKNIKGKDLKLVWISPKLPSQNQDSKYFKIPDITGVESEGYEDNNEIAVRLSSKDEENLLRRLSNERQKIKIIETTQTEIKNLFQLLEKVQPSIEIKKLIEEVHEVLTNQYLLNPKFHIWGGATRAISYNKSTFWIIMQKTLFNICFPKGKANKEILTELKNREKYSKLQENQDRFVGKISEKDSPLAAISIIEEFLNKRNQKNG